MQWCIICCLVAHPPPLRVSPPPPARGGATPIWSVCHTGCSLLCHKSGRPFACLLCSSASHLTSLVMLRDCLNGPTAKAPQCSQPVWVNPLLPRQDAYDPSPCLSSPRRPRPCTPRVPLEPLACMYSSRRYVVVCATTMV